MARLLFAVLLASSLALAACPRAFARQSQRLRIIAPPRVVETGGVTRVTVVADAPLNDYTARQDGDLLSINIPRAVPPAFTGGIFDRGAVGVRAERSGDGVLFSFKLRRGSTAVVSQNFNRLEVLVTPPAAADSDGGAGARPTLDTNTDSPSRALRPAGDKRTEAAGAERSAGAERTAGAERVASALRIPRVARPPKLEEFVGGVPREAGAEVTDFRQRSPEDGAPASRRTAAYLSYDDANLYVVFVCKEQPGLVRAHLSRREDISSDDTVTVALDTFHDRRRAYVFSVNPLGVQSDSITTEGQGDDDSFDTLWHSEGRLTPDGFVALLAIPFKSLRFTDARAQIWGLLLGRTIARNNEESYWPRVTRRIPSYLQQEGALEGLEHVSPGRNVQLIPYGVLARGRSLDASDPNAPAFRGGREERGGLDAKVVFRGAFTLDLTANPDFSQVESDEPQVTVNRRFEVFFPEKRPFFIENAGFFQTPENLFFSRRVADPQYGARLTGKAGGWAVAGLLMNDRAPGREVPEGDPVFGRRAGVGVVRAQREFGEQSSVGVLLTSYDFASSSNRVLSLDARLRLNQNWSFGGQLMHSYDRGADGSRLSGPAYLANLSRDGSHFSYDLTYTDRSPDFRTRLGFVPRVDVRQVEQSASYRWHPNSHGVVSFGPSVFALANWNRRGRVQDWSGDGSFGVEFKGLTSVGVNRSETYELFLGRGFRTDDTGFNFSTDRLKWLGFSGSYSRGTSINYFPPAGLAPFRVDSSGAFLALSLRPSTRLRFEQTYILSRLGAFAGAALPSGVTRSTVLNNHIARSKLNYQFTRELSLRAILDYNAVLPNSSLVALEREKRLTADLLLTYLLNPGTALYVGYTDGYENLLVVPGDSPALRRAGPPFTNTGRRFFVKMSYLFRY